jgi:hypothetical protein
MALPRELDQRDVNIWASESIENHRSRISVALDPSAVAVWLSNFASRFDDEFVSDTAKVLIWFSGKDLLAGMADWLPSKGIVSPREFRNLLRDWIRENPERSLELLPEWNALVDVLRT